MFLFWKNILFSSIWAFASTLLQIKGRVTLGVAFHLLSPGTFSNLVTGKVRWAFWSRLGDWYSRVRSESQLHGDPGSHSEARQCWQLWWSHEVRGGGGGDHRQWGAHQVHRGRGWPLSDGQERGCQHQSWGHSLLREKQATIVEHCGEWMRKYTFS